MENTSWYSLVNGRGKDQPKSAASSVAFNFIWLRPNQLRLSARSTLPLDWGRGRCCWVWVFSYFTEASWLRLVAMRCRVFLGWLLEILNSESTYFLKDGTTHCYSVMWQLTAEGLKGDFWKYSIVEILFLKIENMSCMIFLSKWTWKEPLCNR